MLAAILTSLMLCFGVEYHDLMSLSPMTDRHYTAEIVTICRGKVSRREVYLGPVTIQEAEARVAEELSMVQDGHAYIFSEIRDNSSNPLVTLTGERQE